MEFKHNEYSLKKIPFGNWREFSLASVKSYKRQQSISSLE